MAGEFAINGNVTTTKTEVVAKVEAQQWRDCLIAVRNEAASADQLLVLIEFLHDVTATATTAYAVIDAGVTEYFSCPYDGTPQIYARAPSTNADYAIWLAGKT